MDLRFYANKIKQLIIESVLISMINLDHLKFGIQ